MNEIEIPTLHVSQAEVKPINRSNARTQPPSSAIEQICVRNTKTPVSPLSLSSLFFSFYPSLSLPSPRALSFSLSLSSLTIYLFSLVFHSLLLLFSFFSLSLSLFLSFFPPSPPPALFLSVSQLCHRPCLVNDHAFPSTYAVVQARRPGLR